MSFLDTIKDPVKAAKDGFHALTDTVSHATDIAEDLISKPGSTALNLTSKVITAVTNIDETKIKDTFSAVGTVLSNPIKSLTSAIGLTGDAKTVSSAFSALSLLNPVGGLASLTMTEVTKGKWLSGDKKISVEQVEKFDDKQTADLSSAWALYDKQFPGSKDNVSRTASKDNENGVKSLDFNPDIYLMPGEPAKAGDAITAKAAEATKVATHDYTNAKGESVNVAVGDGSMRYTAKKDGAVVTEATQKAGESTISHSGATAKLNTVDGILQFSNKQLELLQQNGAADIKLANHEIKKDADGRIHVLDKNGKELQSVEMGALVIENAIRMYRAGTDLHQKANETPAPGDNGAAQPQVNVFMTTAGDMLARLQDGSELLRRQQDGNVMLKMASGQVVMVEASSGNLLILRDGKFEKLENDTDEARKTKEALANTGVNVSGRDIRFNGGNLNLETKQMTVVGANQDEQKIDLSQTTPNATTSKVKVVTRNQTIIATGNNEVTTTDATGYHWQSNLDKGDVRTPDVTVTPTEIRAKQDDGQDVIIKSNNDVLFDGGKKDAPQLHHDGSMNLDEQTHTDSHGNVTSGSWHASIGGSYGSDRAAAGTRANLESSATNISATAKTNANSIYGKALSGMVTYSDISALNADLGNVSMLINQLAAAGCTDLIGELQNSAAAIIETINFATPKAQACQIAMDRGISSPSQIKAIEDGTFGRTPEQAVAAAA